MPNTIMNRSIRQEKRIQRGINHIFLFSKCGDTRTNERFRFQKGVYFTHFVNKIHKTKFDFGIPGILVIVINYIVKKSFCLSLVFTTQRC
jgi:hypothetical protein